MNCNKNMGSVLIVDDDPLTLKALSLLLEEHGCTYIACSSAGEAIELSQHLIFDVVVSDIKMPDISGLELMKKMKILHPEKPVILMTGNAELESAVEAVNRGAFKYLLKPFPTEIFIDATMKAVEYARSMSRERNYKVELESIVERRTHELKEALSQTTEMSREVIYRFMKIAECRDTDTGNHISRIGLYSNKLAETLNMSEEFVGHITLASSMHDIGKIGIPDNILLKPGKLTFEEFEIMKSHTVMGQNILAGSSHPVLSMAALIALNHHERWDGTGYPNGLRGDNLPVEGMIVMIVDQYDALRSIRPYKQSLSHDEVLRIITEGDGRTNPEHFSPDILNAFIEIAPVLDEIFSDGSGMSELAMLASSGETEAMTGVVKKVRNIRVI